MIAARLIILLLAPAVLAGGLAVVHPRTPQWAPAPLDEGEVRLETVLQWPEDTYVLLDARTATAYRQDHIPGALLLNEDDWDHLLFQHLEQLATASRVVVYCDSRLCNAAEQVAERLREQGVVPGEILVLHDGWVAWTAHREEAP
jgi:rhodanese-related sulfurtransferase